MCSPSVANICSSDSLLVFLVVVGLWALFARDTTASGPIERYHVQPGDTLWTIATANFAGDPREGVWELQQRNGLDEPDDPARPDARPARDEPPCVDPRRTLAGRR